MSVKASRALPSRDALLYGLRTWAGESVAGFPGYSAILELEVSTVCRAERGGGCSP